VNWHRTWGNEHANQVDGTKLTRWSTVIPPRRHAQTKEKEIPNGKDHKRRRQQDIDWQCYTKAEFLDSEHRESDDEQLWIADPR
jgi:hypothetical protein